MDGKIERGALLPAKPTLDIPEPLSMTTVCTPPSLISGSIFSEGSSWQEAKRNESTEVPNAWQHYKCNMPRLGGSDLAASETLALYIALLYFVSDEALVRMCIASEVHMQSSESSAVICYSASSIASKQQLEHR